MNREAVGVRVETLAGADKAQSRRFTLAWEGVSESRAQMGDRRAEVNASSEKRH
ncbi:MAG: hypothetical protein AAF697_05880 [Pseudomonadota bacterium]